MLLKKNIPLSYVFGKIKLEITLLALYSIAVYVVHTYYRLPIVSIPSVVPSILGTIISLLLAFRSNQAYDRWWEARTLWGAIVNDSRSFARQVLTFVDNFQDDAAKQSLKEWMIMRQIAWCHSLSQHLRGQKIAAATLELLTEDDKKAIAKVKHVPLELMQQHANDLRMLARAQWINNYQQVAMDETLNRFSKRNGCLRTDQEYGIPGYL